MDGDASKAKRYRERAEGLRSIAQDLPSDNVQRIILSLAVEYERLARLLDGGDSVRDDPLGLLATLRKPDNSS